ncbi:MAG TPA: hypothetical protein VFT64_02060 [Rickettsiales bacterium]|nr:hypothetical protein [Rickettsiales bacterium]
MQYGYQRRCESGLLWIAAFAMIAIATVATCIHQEKTIAQHASIVVAMRQ